MVSPLVGRFHPKPRRQIREMFCALPPESIDVLDDLLRLNPAKRLTSQQAIDGKDIYVDFWKSDFLAKWFEDLDENCIAELDGAEALHEMSARRNRRAKKRKKTQEDKIKRAKALLQPHPGKFWHEAQNWFFQIWLWSNWRVKLASSWPKK